MNEATIDSLKLEVESSSDGASKGLDALTHSLKKLQKATSKGLGLTAVVNELKSADTSIKSSSLDGLTKAVETLTKLGGVKISSSVGNQITAISTALQGANFEGGAEKMQSLVTALEPLGQLGKSNLSSYVTTLKKLPAVITELNKLDMSAVKAKMQEVADAIKPLGDEMQKIANGFSAFPAKIQKLIANMNTLPKANKAAASSFTDLYHKIKMAANSVKTIAQKIASWITLSSDYTETMNLFTVSMGKYAEEAYNYAQSVGNAMGIDPAEWMKHQGVFMTLTKGFGVVGDRANTMSQQLTQLGYDLSSFFNISVEDAMTKLESGIAGELEPLRRLGYDLSQAKLEATSLSLGIDKAVSSMTQAEKAELRYYAIMTQVTDAHHDMARTLNAPANQLRILNAQVTQLGRSLGNFFIPLLNKVLPYIIASVKVLREVLDVFMDLLGIELADVDFGKGSITSATDDIVSNLEDGQKEAKKLKSYMLGFDELNVIDTDDGEDGLDDLLGKGFNFELPTYNFMEGIVATQVDEIVKKMKEWLGLTEPINSWSDFLDTKLGNILETVGLIGLGIAAWKVTKEFMDALSTIKTLSSSPNNTITIGVAMTTTGVAMESLGIESAVTQGLDGFNFAEIVGGGLLTTGGASLLGSKIAAWITTTFAGSAIANAIATAGTNLGGLTAGAVGVALGAGVAGIIAGLPAYFVGIYDACTSGIDWLNGLLIPAGATAAGAGIGAIIGACGGPIGAGIGAIIGLIVGLVTDGIILIVQKWDVIKKFFTETIPGWWDDFCKWVKGIPKTVKKWFKDLSKKIDKFFDDVWKPIKDFDWSGLGYDIGQWFGNAWVSAVTFVTETIPNWFSDMWESVKSSFKKFFTQTLPNFFTQTIPDMWETIKTEFVTFFTETLPNSLSDIKSWFVDVGESIIDGIWEGLQTVWNAITDFVDGFVQGFKDALGIHSPSTVFAEIGGFLIEGLFGGMLEWLGSIGDWCKTHIVEPFNKAMSGVLEFAVNVKNNSSEWWSNVKTWWGEKVGDVKEFGTNVANNASTWWSNTKAWWQGVVGNVKEFGTNVANNASTWWNNVKTWWSGKVGDVANFATNVTNNASTWWSNVKSWWAEKASAGLDAAVNLVKKGWSSLVDFVGNAVSVSVSLTKKAWTSITNFVGNAVSVAISIFKNGWSSISNFVGTAVSTGVSLFKNGWSSISSFVGTTVSVGIKLFKDGWSSIKNWIGDLVAELKIKLPHIDVKWEDTGFMGVKYPKFSVSYYAQGGFPDMGQLFVAREAGAELVGNIGGRTAVMNNDQIVESVSTGVYQAVIAALGGNNDDGEETNIVINLDGEKIYENQQKIARGRGYNLGMGAFSFG